MKKLILITTLCLFSSVSWSQECVEGNCENGFGTYTYPSGSRYSGMWKNKKRDGQGTFYSIDGEKHNGEWKKGKKDGLGTYYDSKGNLKQQGIWVKDSYFGTKYQWDRKKRREKERVKEKEKDRFNISIIVVLVMKLKCMVERIRVS